MKKIFRVFIVLILFILIIVMSCTAMMNKEMEKAKNELMLVEDPDLSKVEDGIYRGKVETMLVKAEVEVSVKNHKIISISIIKHENGKGKPAEAIVDAIAQQVQKLYTEASLGTSRRCQRRDPEALQLPCASSSCCEL